MSRLLAYLPLYSWLKNYQRDSFVSDMVAGIVVGIMLIPQGMAYAFLAGLPPQYGLYAAIIPLFLYALLGSSRSLAVGPVAIASLMVGSTIADSTARGLGDPVTIAINLSLLVGVILILLRIMRLGAIVNFMSHSVISGFTSAAALLIAISQIRHLTGLNIPSGGFFTDTFSYLLSNLQAVNSATLLLGLSGLFTLWFVKAKLCCLLERSPLPVWLVQPVCRAGPMFAMIVGIVLVASLQLEQSHQVAIVGAIPEGLPTLSLISIDLQLWQQLLTPAFLIALIGFLESVSVGTTLASKRRERIDPNKELIALGAANLGAAFSGTYPVAGGFGRSMVNHSAGAQTTIASIISALMVVITVSFFTPLFYYLPKAVLGAVIIMAVIPLIDVKSFTDSWRFNKADALTLLGTFAFVLLLGVELGIMAGIAISFILLLYRSSQPHIAVVGRVGDSQHFRNIQRHDVATDKHILAIRVDESLYFANTRFVEDFIRAQCASHRQVEHVVLICNAVNFIDASALESLENLSVHLQSQAITLHFAEVKGPVMDQLQSTRFIEQISPGRIFFTTDEAVRELGLGDAEVYEI
ncbi:SulP family inorganic anion transporter [Amphritea balenae]|uniref:Sulfate permease n=1 Tax=Amphritea balenae TaxID=452629 RepID=A0A3P1SNK9_9GAMM|nr:sulfate permease [Amphritea balenae]RRC98534.1 sulfate permease [Amphritea balenae]GGK65320.1 sodium-independent anion transporter [Amphritea balenae]